jgi:hypothetical protein
MFSQADLEAYLDEALRPEEMARIEQAARNDEQLRRRLAEIHARRDAGVHSLGEIWRRGRLSCPGRAQLSDYLCGTLVDEYAAYVKFHLETIGCRWCRANLDDLKAHGPDIERTTTARRRKYFQSSAGYLEGKK